MKKVFLAAAVLFSLVGSAQHYIQASIQQGATANSVNIVFLPNYTSAANEYVNYLSLSIAIPTSSATGVTPSISMTGPFSNMAMVPAVPFSYTAGALTIFSWVYSSGPSTMSWTNGTAFTGATITFNGGTGSANVSLVDFTNCPTSGGDNTNTFYLIVTNVSPFDVTNYSNLFYSLSGGNGSTIGTGPCSSDPIIQTNLPIFLSSFCPAPTSLHINGTSSTTAQISWNPVPGVSNYEYQLTTNSSPSGGKMTNGVSFDTTGLAVGTQYTFYVRSICSPGNYSGWSNISFATICPATTSIAISDTTPSGAKIKWSSTLPSALGYQYVVDQSAGDPSPSAAKNILEDSVTVSGLTEGTMYYAHIRVNCSPGVFSNWTTTSFITPFKPCGLPGLPNVIASGNGATINWGSAIGSISYQLAVTTNQTVPAFGKAVSSTNSQVTQLNTNTVYYVFIRSECRPGVFSDWVYAAFKTTCLKPSPFVIENSLQVGTVKLGWNKINGILNYEYAILPTAAPPSGSINTTIDTVLQINNLIPGGKYYLHVRTHCSATIISDWSTLAFYTSGIIVAPNPFNDIVVITQYGSGIQKLELKLYDVNGKLLQKIILNGSASTSINLKNYPAGTYFIRSDQHKSFFKKLIKY